MWQELTSNHDLPPAPQESECALIAFLLREIRAKKGYPCVGPAPSLVHRWFKSKADPEANGNPYHQSTPPTKRARVENEPQQQATDSDVTRDLNFDRVADASQMLLRDDEKYFFSRLADLSATANTEAFLPNFSATNTASNTVFSDRVFRHLHAAWMESGANASSWMLTTQPTSHNTGTSSANDADSNSEDVSSSDDERDEEDDGDDDSELSSCASRKDCASRTEATNTPPHRHSLATLQRTINGLEPMEISGAVAGGGFYLRSTQLNQERCCAWQNIFNVRVCDHVSRPGQIAAWARKQLKSGASITKDAALFRDVHDFVFSRQLERWVSVVWQSLTKRFLPYLLRMDPAFLNTTQPSFAAAARSAARVLGYPDEVGLAHAAIAATAPAEVNQLNAVSMMRAAVQRHCEIVIAAVRQWDFDTAKLGASSEPARPKVLDIATQVASAAKAATSTVMYSDNDTLGGAELFKERPAAWCSSCSVGGSSNPTSRQSMCSCAPMLPVWNSLERLQWWKEFEVLLHLAETLSPGAPQELVRALVQCRFVDVQQLVLKLCTTQTQLRPAAIRVIVDFAVVYMREVHSGLVDTNLVATSSSKNHLDSLCRTVLQGSLAFVHNKNNDQDSEPSVDSVAAAAAGSSDVRTAAIATPLKPASINVALHNRVPPTLAFSPLIKM
jgi:hypothetical protein